MVKTLWYGGGCVQDVKRDEDGMEVMDLDDDEDERRDLGEGALSEDSGREVGVRGPLRRFLSPRQGQLY